MDSSGKDKEISRHLKSYRALQMVKIYQLLIID